MEGELLLPLYLYRFIRLDFVTANLVVGLDYTIIILGGYEMDGILKAVVIGVLTLVIAALKQEDD